MIVLGIDPGLKTTGYGLINVQQRNFTLLETGTINPKQKDPIEDRLNKVYAGLDTLIKKYQPQVLVLEKIYTHHTYPTTAGILGHVRGVICLLCAQNHLELVEHSVKRVRKAVTGNGNATKNQTQQMVKHLLKINASDLSLDASDALALALGYGYLK